MSSLKNAWSNVPQLKWAVVMLGVMLAVALLSKWTGHTGPRYNRKFMKNIEVLVKQARSWHQTAEQDQNKLVALIHANFAIAYLNSVRQVVSDKEIERITKVNVPELQVMFEATQQQLLEDLGRQYPALRATNVHTIGQDAWTAH